MCHYTLTMAVELVVFLYRCKKDGGGGRAGVPAAILKTMSSALQRATARRQSRPNYDALLIEHVLAAATNTLL